MVNDKSKFSHFDHTFKPDEHYVERADGRRSNKIVTARGEATFDIIDSNGLTQQINLKKRSPSSILSYLSLLRESSRRQRSKDILLKE